jgi:ketosteroid isomerase-like protein
MTVTNKDIVLRLTQAFTDQDRATITELLADDCVWRVPGRAPISGVYTGREAIMGFFGRLKRAIDEPATFEVIDVASSDERVVLYQYGMIRVRGREAKLRECLVYTVRNGQVVDMDEFQSDLHEFDSLFAEA